ncbi:MAG: hypothetical protein ACR2RB_21660 [Gammaproteobacteria bacterium]
MLGPIVVVGLSILIISIYMQPISGELTRLGGYLENHYGWNEPQEVYPKPLFMMADNLSQYDRYYDVVVLGDSFSDNQLNGWQNYFVARTGLSLISFSLIRYNVDDLLQFESFKRWPPSFFIYQSVERNVVERNRDCAELVNREGSSVAKPIAIAAKEVTTRYEGRGQNSSGGGHIIFDEAVNFVKKAAIRNILNINTTETRRLALSRDDLFSSRNSQDLLVYLDDFVKLDQTLADIEIARCSLLNTQHKVEEGGTTRFVALVFPDKSTAYARYLVDERYATMSKLHYLQNDPDLTIADTLSRFEEALNEDVVDLYLPNDTHCGFKGYKLATESVLDLMLAKGLVNEGSHKKRIGRGD